MWNLNFEMILFFYLILLLFFYILLKLVAFSAKDFCSSRFVSEREKKKENGHIVILV